MAFNKLFLAFFVLAALMAPSASYAADLKIAIVDIEKIRSESEAGKSIQKQLSTRRESFQKEFATREDSLMNLEKTLIEQKASLSPEDFAKKRKEFEKQLSETKNLFRKRRKSLDKGLGNALTQLRKNIVQITDEIAADEGFVAVLRRDSVITFQKEMDITAKVLKRLNKKMPSIKLDIAE